VASIDVTGPTAQIARHQDGVIEAFGLRYAPPTARAPAAPAEPPPPETAPAAAASEPAPAARKPPRFVIGKIAWHGVQLALKDAMVKPAATIQLADAGLEIGELVMDMDPNAAPPPPVSLRAWLAAPDVVERATITGTLGLRPHAPSADLAMEARGLTLAALREQIKPFGIEPALAAGSLEGKLKANAELLVDSTRASLSLEGVSYRDGDSEIAGLDGLTVRDLVIAPSGMSLAALELNHPRASVAREADGALLAGGLRLRKPAPAADDTLTPPPPEPAPEASPEAPPPPRPATPARTTEMPLIRIADAEIHWADAAVTPAVATTARAQLEVHDLVLGRSNDKPTPFVAELALDQSLEQLRAEGSLQLDPSRQHLDLTVDSHGLRAGPLTSYLPPGMAVTLADGRITMKMSADVVQNPAGGQGVRLSVKDASYRDGEAGEPFVALDELRLVAPRLDGKAKVFAADEVVLAGLTLAAERGPEGKLAMMGLEISPPPPAQPGEAAPVPAPAPAEPQPPKGIVLQRSQIPALSLAKIDLDLARFTFRDRTQPDSTPVMTALHLRNKTPVVLDPEDPDSMPPLELALTGRAVPVLDELDVDLKLTPFAIEPELLMTFNARGLRGPALVTSLPALREKIDGRELTDGRFKGALELLLKLGRRNALDFSVARGFGLDLQVKDVEFRNGDEGPMLMGLGAFEADVAKIEPSGGVHVRSIEIDKAMATVAKDQDGLHAMGLIVKLPPPPEQQPAEAQPPPEAPPPAAPVAEAPPAAPGPLMRVDRFSWSGLDFTFTDRTTDPVTVVPISGLEIDVRNLSNRLGTEPQSVPFSIVVEAGNVVLPRVQQTGFLAGAFKDTLKVVSGQDTAERSFDQRPMFGEITLNGNLALYPHPSGVVKSSVSGLELVAVKGEAAKSGVIIDDGTFDHRSKIVFAGDGTMNVESKTSFTQLSLSEPPDGPIVRYLHLPAPLDTVLFVLRDDEGMHQIPLDLSVPAEGVSAGVITQAAIAALGTLVANAIASAPMRLASNVTDVFSSGDADPKNKREPPITLLFASGDAAFTPEDAQRLAPIFARIAEGERLSITLEHKLGADDLSRAVVRANPSQEQSEQIAGRLRLFRRERSQEREALATEAAANYAAGRVEEAQRFAAQVRALDRELGLAEVALDHTYKLLEPSAPRRAPRRTKESCLGLADQRLAVVKSALLDHGLTDDEDVLRIARPRFDGPQAPEAGYVEVTVVSRKE
jgi:hypothetical protein